MGLGPTHSPHKLSRAKAESLVPEDMGTPRELAKRGDVLIRDRIVHKTPQRALPALDDEEVRSGVGVVP